MKQFDLAAFAYALNAKAHAYSIGDLQQIRAELHGKKRAGRTIFRDSTITDDWAFHYGGRTELQFNIGFDDSKGTKLRYGVAFSLETGINLQTIDPLVPKVKLFNDFLLQYPDLYSDMRMWHWHNNVRSSETLAAPIPQELVTAGVFIFLGMYELIRDLNQNDVLAVMDRLLPLYKYIESNGDKNEVKDPIANGFVFQPGYHPKAQFAKATYAQRELDLNLRHNIIQDQLYRDLVKVHGLANVRIEQPTGSGTCIDAVVRKPHGYWYYEVKTALTPRTCVRDAIGQLLEYSLWPGAQSANKYIIVGEGRADKDTQEYCKRLQSQHSLAIEYQQIIIGTHKQ